MNRLIAPILALLGVAAASVAIAQTNQSDVTGVSTQEVTTSILGSPPISVDIGSSVEAASAPQSLCPGMIGDTLYAALRPSPQPQASQLEAIRMAVEKLNDRIEAYNRRAARLKSGSLPQRLNECRSALAGVYAGSAKVLDAIGAYYDANPEAGTTPYKQVGEQLRAVETVVDGFAEASRKLDRVRFLVKNLA